MKKKVFVFLLVFLFVGCGYFHLNDTQSVVLQVAAKRVGYYVGKNNPSHVPMAKVWAQGLISADNDSAMIKAMLKVGIAELAKLAPNEPLMASDVALVADSLQLDVPGSQLDITQLQPVLRAFIEGMDVGAQQVLAF